MPRRFHDEDILLPPATLTRRLLAIIYDGLICIAVLMVTTWLYTLVAAWVMGFDQYEAKMEAGTLEADPVLSSLLFVVLYLFFGYFWTRSGQTLGMQVWRIRVQNLNGISISWSQSLKRFMMAAVALFGALLCLYHWGSWSLIILAPAVGLVFWPFRGESLVDRVSKTQVVRVPNPDKKK
ncbi:MULTISPECIES: RDD family protein [Marinobacter]|uniref:RDD family protein n=1 Tax=Marinobacter TaxID=2742 RepID=UPI001D06BF12|nr:MULTISPECIES: RDD family protein [Marinobacter]MCK7566838.1 RDD family protein [Marinobacter xestospongiae]UDL03638.1 RDD family protein [Marinobacter sp. CA1]